MNELTLWTGPEEITLPEIVASDYPKGLGAIVDCSNNQIISTQRKNQIMAAFSVGAYHMGAEYVWRYAMSALKNAIASLGMKFVGEMLDRDDIDEYSSPETVLSDYTAISLADKLGIVNKTGTLRLRQALDLVNHFFSNDSEGDIEIEETVSIVKSSVRYILGHRQVAVAEDFSNLRKRLQTESLTKDDGQLATLMRSALFYIRTVLNILLNNIKSSKGAPLEHSIANLNLILPLTWDRLAETDKWNVGKTYRDVVTDGNEKSAVGIKKALLKVKGFDYVPESLRSNTFKKAAKAVIDTHFAYNNFYNEPSVVRSLASLGSIIPEPALQECMDAYLLVYLGNVYGVSVAAAPIAERELLAISSDNWKFFFNSIFPKDELLLIDLKHSDQVNRFSDLLKNLGPEFFENLEEGDSRKLYNAIIKGDTGKYKDIRKHLLKQL